MDAPLADSLPTGRKDPKIAIAYSPLFTKLSAEIRARVYQYDLPTRTTIKITKRLIDIGHKDSLTFTECDEKDRGVVSGVCLRCKRGGNRGMDHGCEEIDTALLMVSRAVFTEVLHFLLHENRVDIAQIQHIQEIADLMTPFFSSIRPIIIHPILPKIRLPYDEALFWHGFGKRLPLLKEITIYGCVYSEDELLRTISEIGVLRFLRLLKCLCPPSTTIRFHAGSTVIGDPLGRLEREALQILLMPDADKIAEAKKAWIAEADERCRK